MKFNGLHFASILLLVFFFVGLFFTLRYFGQRYNNGLSSLIQKPADVSTLPPVRKVHKITIKDDQKGCTEITPDGVVRTFVNCDGNLTDVSRVANPKNVLDLIQLASEIDFSKYKTKPLGLFLTLTIETDNGTETIYVPQGSGGGDITHTIDLINGDLPQPSQTPGPNVELPTPTMGGVSSTETPTPSVEPTFGPSPTPAPTDIPLQSFTCGFTSGGQKIPYNISNYICSTGPSPAP